MRKVIVLFAALAFSGPAFAADMALKGPPPPPAPVWSWTGFYVGLNGGYGWNSSTGDGYCINPGGVLNGGGCWTPTTGVVKPNGGLFGGQAGYNFQSGSIVYGVETDIQWSGINGSGAVPDPCCSPTPTATGLFNATSKVDWFGTFRGRVGVLASPNALLYVTGGLIYGHESVSDAFSYAPNMIIYPAAASSTRAGGTAGGGLEYAFTPNFSGKVEGLWYDMGSLTDGFTCPNVAISLTCSQLYTSGATYHFRGGIVRAGFNWKFASGH